MSDAQAAVAAPKPQRKPRRRTRCMFKDEKGRWWLDFYAPNGQRRRKLAGKTKGDADRLLRQIRTSIDSGEFVDSSKAPGFSGFCEMFMKRHGQHKASYRDGASWLNRLKQHFGDRRISAITAGHIEEYRLIRLDEPDARDGKRKLSLSTIDREIDVLRAMLSRAVKWGYISKNPAAQVEDYAEDNKRERFLSRDEIRKLLGAAKTSNSTLLRPAIFLALQTGLRKMELLSLRWSDIDFEVGQLLIRETKNGEPRRVPMSRRARWALSKLAARNPLAEWVFESRNAKGERAAAKDTKTAWKTVLRNAQIEDFRFHDLRHTFASHFAMKGGNIYALAKIMGHSNPKMTLDRYSHLSPEYVNEQRRIMDAPNYTPVLSNGH